MRVDERFWEETSAELHTVVGTNFLRTSPKAPKTLRGVVEWFEKNHPEEVKQIEAPRKAASA